MAKAVKLADIAGELGVSIVTVSKALSGQKGVSEDLREKIIKLADEKGYKLPAERTEPDLQNVKIGVLVHERYLDSRDSFYIKLYQEIVTKAIPMGVFVTLQVVNFAMEKSGDIDFLIGGQQLDGLIVLGRFSEKFYSRLVEKCSVPIMNTDFYYENYDMDSIVSDNYFGAYRLTNYLYDMGHTSISFVGSIGATDSIMDRYMGYMKSVIEHGDIVREDWVIPDWTLDTAEQYRKGDFNLPDEMPTAFFCNNDMTAGVLINQLESLGYEVPEDFSIVGYDNYIYPGMCDVEITTYEVDLPEMAQQSVNNLIKKVRDNEHHTGMRIVQGHLVEKSSVKKIN